MLKLQLDAQTPRDSAALVLVHRTLRVCLGTKARLIPHLYINRESESYN